MHDREFRIQNSVFRIRQSYTMSKVQAYFRDSYRELMEKVSWPSWQQLQQSTMIVLVATLVITGVVAVMDFTSSSVLKFVYSLFK
jgi:preprotein translocase subunit SecE